MQNLIEAIVPGKVASVAKLASAIGVHPNTLHDWLKPGKVANPGIIGVVQLYRLAERSLDRDYGLGIKVRESEQDVAALKARIADLEKREQTLMRVLDKLSAIEPGSVDDAQLAEYRSNMAGLLSDANQISKQRASDNIDPDTASEKDA